MEKLDILYILGAGSRWHDNEIRYSLRSVEKYLNINKVFIVGEIPEWMTNVVHIPTKDKSINKLINARAKYLAGANNRELSARFILMNDDFFILKQTEIKNYTRGKTEIMIRRHQTMAGYYFKALCQTKNRLDAMGITDPKDFEVHSPIIFDKEKLKTVIAMMGENSVYLLRTAYGNMTNLETTKVEDFKACNVREFENQLKRKAEFLSINDALVICPEFTNWLKVKYPDVSKYELDGGAGANLLPGRSMNVLNYTATRNFMYGGRQYTGGEKINKETMDELKRIPKLKDNWTLK